MTFTPRSDHRNGQRPDFTKEDFAFVARLAKTKFGLNLSESKMPLVQSRISKRMRELNIHDFRSYRSILSQSTNQDEEEKLLSVLTTNVTNFFREKHHFDHMKKSLLEKSRSKSEYASPVRIWSAASSTGQEIVSAAMIAADTCVDDHFSKFEFFASDIDPVVIKRARLGVYSVAETKDIPRKYMDRFTQKVSETTFQINPHIMSKIQFKVLNLISNFSKPSTFDYIFCRNAAIYFDEETQVGLWTRLSDSLKSGGILYIGHSERIHGPATKKLRSQGITAYEKL